MQEEEPIASSVTVPKSVSAIGSVSTGSVAPALSVTVPVPAFPAASASPAQLTSDGLMAILNIPPYLIDRDDTSLKFYYQKYKAILQAQHTVDDMFSKGQWPAHQRKPSQTDIIKLFISPSMWHSHVKKLSKVSDYPRMQEWLEGGVNAPDDVAVWGFSKSSYTFVELQGYFIQQDEIKAGAKGKEKDVGGSKKKGVRKNEGSSKGNAKGNKSGKK
jgi:hypothetical protein